MYKMILNDGTEISGLRMVNNTLRSKTELTAEMFAGKLTPVTISGVKEDCDDEDWGGIAGTHEHADVAYVRQEDGEYSLAIYDIDPEVWSRKRNEADIQYLAMMSGVEL